MKKVMLNILAISFFFVFIGFLYGLTLKIILLILDLSSFWRYATAMLYMSIAWPTITAFSTVASKKLGSIFHSQSFCFFVVASLSIIYAFITLFIIWFSDEKFTHSERLAAIILTLMIIQLTASIMVGSKNSHVDS